MRLIHAYRMYSTSGQAEDAIRKYEDGTLELRPGCDILQSLEEILNGILGKLRESAGQEAMRALVSRIMAHILS